MRRLLVLALIVLSPACKSTTTTPPGTDVVRWDKSMATRESVPGAKELGERATTDRKVVVHPDLKGPVTLKLHIVTAPIELVESRTSRHTTPVEIRATIDANDDWTINGKCDRGPDYQTGPVDGKGVMTSPEAMVLSCFVDMKYASTFRDLSTLLRLVIKGDGTVELVMGSGTATVE